ncbi:MAG: 1,6-anhydro-N-acetylmuramyl-L-alanine amidase AmpD [Gammaproteobacteria bacterium]|nr:MAG: 1,6-anhydro-N-acetylmuramyl-L-alanine amidase AmpD [Gammaproteobacteria bacterium]
MSKVDPGTGWLKRVRRVPSPNQDARPAGCVPELIVIHGISLPPGRFGGPWIDRLFTNTLPPDADPYFAALQSVRVSAHLLIARGGRLTQYVPFSARAWHAGRSYWGGRTDCNDFSVGIELEGTDERPYTARQYRTLTRVILALQHGYPALAAGAIAGHSDVAPRRKTDPGPAFDWARLEDGLRATGARFLREVLV